MIVLDTNVFSELSRPRPDERVVDWIDGQDRLTLALTTITVAELRSGVRAMTPGRKRRDLDRWVEAVVTGGIVAQVLPFDVDATGHYGDIRAARRRSGPPIDPLDAQIAAICTLHGATLATRNVKDFEGTGIDLINPWTA